jgi:hypothetical protein
METHALLWCQQQEDDLSQPLLVDDASASEDGSDNSESSSQEYLLHCGLAHYRDGGPTLSSLLGNQGEAAADSGPESEVCSTLCLLSCSFLGS